MESSDSWDNDAVVVVDNDSDDDEFVDDACTQSPAPVAIGAAIDDADVDEGDGKLPGDEDDATVAKGRTSSAEVTAVGCAFVRMVVVEDGIVFVMTLGPQSIS